MSRKMQYLLWLGVLILLEALVIIAEFRSPTVHRGFTALMWTVYWLWNGILLMTDLHPEWRKWDRWERRTYGLSFAVMGVCFLPVFFGCNQCVGILCADTPARRSCGSCRSILVCGEKTQRRIL